MPAKKAFGTFLQAEIAAVFTNIANVVNLEPVDLSADIIDASSHDSPDEYRDKLAGFKDAGDIKLELNYDPANATHQYVESILAASNNFKIKYVGSPTGRTTGAFAGIVKSFSTGAPHDGKLTASVVIAVSGKITWS